MVKLIQPNSPTLWDVARNLVKEYERSLNVDLCFQDFDEEIKNFSQMYGLPNGDFLLAEELGEFVGCVGFRKYSFDTCEMKRLYVIPEKRGIGVGRKLTEKIIAEARRHGYKRMILDTLPTMHEAQNLYTSLGFKTIPAYRFNPVDGTKYMELLL